MNESLRALCPLVVFAFGCGVGRQAAQDGAAGGSTVVGGTSGSGGGSDARGGGSGGGGTPSVGGAPGVGGSAQGGAESGGRGGSSGGEAGAKGDSGNGGSAGNEPPSCADLEPICGPDENEECCTSLAVPGGTFNRSNDPMYPATVSDFRLDRFEVIVGRFRAFVEAYPGSRPDAGAGRNPSNASDPGWDSNWPLPEDQATLLEELDCVSGDTTWSDIPSLGSTRLPINCITWFMAFAFCIWDGGRLPTEAEWNYAAAGGDEQRPYPWSASSTDETLDESLAVYDQQSWATVGSKSPQGDGRWGHADLAGNMSEFVLDTVGNYPVPCNDCVNLVGSSRVDRGGNHNDANDTLLTAERSGLSPAGRAFTVGMRCARAP